jgi:hypothetical protein
VKTCNDPKGFIALHNRPNGFLVCISHKQFLFSKSFKPRTFISGVFIKLVFQQFVALFKFVHSFHIQILLGRLENVPGEIAARIKAECEGDITVGRSIESALGIKINSSGKPDYKGIEIKSGRTSVGRGKGTRATLFGCVPDWDLSALKSSRAILEKFGYERGSDFKLYCSVTTQRANSQGLQFEVKEADKWLREFCAREPVEEVCIWRLDRLHEKLAEKHNETFWVKAKSIQSGGNEWFQLESVTHTTRPSLNQFDRLLTDGTVTMDHLSKRDSEGYVTEKGPLFKIDRPRIGELFLGEPRNYSLLS